MKYLCLIYDDERVVNALSPAERKERSAGYFSLTTEMRAAGQLVAGEALQPAATATTLRVRDGTLSTTDGPYAETKEQLAGFYLVDAADVDEVVRLAARFPSATIGGVEVRPVVDFGPES